MLASALGTSLAGHLVAVCASRPSSFRTLADKCSHLEGLNLVPNDWRPGGREASAIEVETHVSLVLAFGNTPREPEVVPMTTGEILFKHGPKLRSIFAFMAWPTLEEGTLPRFWMLVPGFRFPSWIFTWT